MRGFSLLELVVVTAIGAILTAMAIPSRPNGLFQLRNAQTLLVSDLRMARGSAIAQGVHYRVEIVDGDTYEIWRMMEVGGVWVQDGAAEITRELAPTVSLAGSTSSGYEFNTRGIMVDPTAGETMTLVDSESSNTRTVNVWPSGQVVPGDAL